MILMSQYAFVEGKDVDDILLDWAFNPEIVLARLIRASDGRYVLQMRVDLGLLQMEISHRPDGMTPFGFKTYLAYLNHEAAKQKGQFALQPEHWNEAFRELRQFSQRRHCWLALGFYANVVQDADHSLALMDFLQCHLAEKVSPKMVKGEQAVGSVAGEFDRTLVVLQRIQATTMLVLHSQGPLFALNEITAGIRQILELARKNPGEKMSGKKSLTEEGGSSDNHVDWKIDQLLEMKQKIQHQYGLASSYEEHLEEAVRREDYESAARLRDLIRRTDCSFSRYTANYQ